MPSRSLALATMLNEATRATARMAWLNGLAVPIDMGVSVSMLRIALRVLKPTMECCAAQMKCRIASKFDSDTLWRLLCGAAPGCEIVLRSAPEIEISHRLQSHSVFPSRRVVANAPPIAAVDLSQAGAQH